MGKKLIIKGANFSENAIQNAFDPIEWFVNALDSAAGPDNPEGQSISSENTTGGQIIQNTGMKHPSTSRNSYLYYMHIQGATYNRYCTRQMVSLSALYNHGYTSIKFTPKAVSTVTMAYSETPEISSTNIFYQDNWSYNTDVTQKTMSITADTYIVFMAKTESSTKSSITDYVDIEIE